LTFGQSVYHHVALTYDGTTAKEYLDGAFDLTLATPTAVANPNNLFRFFLDNSTGGSTSEYGPGRVALVRLWDGVLSDPQVASLAANPFTVPEPGTLLLTGTAAVGGLLRLRRRRVV